MHQRVRGGRGARNKYTWGGGGGKMDITDGTGPSPPGWLFDSPATPGRPLRASERGREKAKDVKEKSNQNINMTHTALLSKQRESVDYTVPEVLRAWT